MFALGRTSMDNGAEQGDATGAMSTSFFGLEVSKSLKNS